MDEDESKKPGPSRPTKYVPPMAPDAAPRNKKVPSQRGRSVEPALWRNTSNDAQHIQRQRGVSTSRQQGLSAERKNELFPKPIRTLNKFQLPQRQRGATRDTSQGRNQQRSHNVFPNQRIRGRISGDGVRRQNIHGYHSMGFVTLENIAKSNISEIFLNLNKHREGFMEILNSPIHRLDMFVLIFEVFSKVSQSPFEEIKSKLFLDACNSNFMTYLRNYLTDLPYTTTYNKSQNNMYWNDQNEFWKNFITFCRDIVDISPATAVRTCRALIESVSITCLEHLNQRHAFILLEDDKLRLEELRNKLMNYADKREAKAQENADDVSNNDSDMKPPEDFRELSVIPSREDLLDAQPFLRPNIVNGAYSDVEHYLDVQFRLLREDCFGPIRVGVGQYLADPTKRKYDHIRIFRNVKFAGPYITNLKVGTLVQIDIESNRNFKRINWAHSKRLLFGSLVLFTKNNFSEFIVATILDRDNILLSNGKLAVSIIDTSYGGNLGSGDEDAYTMIESEVYYEPYFHLMKALQGPSFSDQIPMQQYIVKVTPAADKPAYLSTDKKFIISDADESKERLVKKDDDPSSDSDDSNRYEDLFSNVPKIQFTVLQPETWPTKEQLKFNESQYEAYKLALTHEFAVIQGPPGTGKTYVGLNVAKALLKNIDPGRQCLMLVICYTNHALDQFLVEISHVTKSIVRIGGQSRNKDMDKFNLAALRKAEGVRTSHLNNYFMETKMNLKKSIEDFQDSLLLLDILNNGVINSDYQEAVTDIPQIQLLYEFYERFPSIKNPLIHWLFENYTEYYSHFNECLSEYDNLPITNNDNDYNNFRTDNIVVLDDDKDRESRLESSKKRMASFMINDAKLALKKLVTQYLHADKKINFKEKMSLELAIADLNSKINFYSEMIKQRSRDIHLNINYTTDFTKIAQQIRWRLYFMWIKPVIKATKAKIAGFQLTLPDQSNLVRWGKATDKTCNSCGEATGTARHLLVGCMTLLDRGHYSHRHDKVLEIIREAVSLAVARAKKGLTTNQRNDIAFVKEGCSKKSPQKPYSILIAAVDWTILVDTYEKHYKIPEDICASSSRPDIFLFSRSHRRAVLVSTVGTNIPKDHAIKTNKYFDLTNELTKNGYVVKLYAVEVGARGIPAKSLYNLLKDLGLPRASKSVTPLATAYDETRMMMDLELLKNKKIKVLGLTTSGAARMRKLLLAVSPKIVIVEEAAEVLEQHIITSLTKDCQHLILIGDHQQLKPSASYIKLARQYNIEVSLFERMITNGIHSRRLNVQHRMRPEIAALISPHIYPDLENHPTVENFGNVRGVEKNVFFFTHEYREEANANNESNSRANHKEADLTLALANYLIQQGYKSDEVTILAAYSGQMFYMSKERQKYACLKGLKITVVDNYQGEESKIILLSLVRNNPENIIGFLGTENRICVALSRAKQGFFMFGNINMLKEKSELWKKIAATLEEQGSLGPVLSLKCQVHPEQITHVATAEDFDNVPEGGCLRKCNYQYKCGHHCLLYCHAYDREHVDTKCPEKCERILCDLGHVCPLKCHEDCGECKVLVRKSLPCGHEMEVYCHRAPDDPRNECLTKVDVVLPKCAHKVQKNCHLNIEKVKCTEKCKQRLENCGHACERLCHVNYPGHKDYVCLKVCTKRKRGCMAELQDDLGPHQCKKECYQACDDCNVQVYKKRSNCKHVARVACCVNVDDTPCNKNCARLMACGHFCKKKCSEQCGDCKTKVTKVIPDCNHEIKVECQKVVSRKDCTEKCKKTLPCGHPCMDMCSVTCDESNCKKLLEIEVDSPCGHKVKLPCNVYRAFNKGDVQPKKLLEYCKSPCGEELACKHICSGSCSQCHQGRLHAPCKQTCHQINICGHQCLEPCNQICPPCNAVCEVQCQHSRCGRMCGEPCVECKEKCSRACPHGACTRLCSETCSRAACGAACARALACGHRCRGVCGEPCPPVCRACRPGDFPTDFLGDEYGDDDKFILLQDCGHVLELENMDNLMMGDQENIQIRQCPFCRKPIINTNRYKDLVNKMIKNDINPIKEKVYGKNTEIAKKLTELKAKVKLTYLKVVREHAGLRKTLENLMSFMQTRKKMFLLQVEMLLIFYGAMEMLAECWKAYHNTKSTILAEEMEAQITMILKALKIDLKSKVPIKISEQQQKDIGNEIKRLNAIVQLAKLLQSGEHLKNDPKAKFHIEVAKNRVLTLSVFEEDKAVEALKVLQTTIKSSGVVSKLEREMIVKAVGVKAGHWYKCPNGHFYCIDRCGGATEVSKCPDCGAAIGGTNHALLRDNAHAPEMDGSQFAAYSEEANNMANFQILFD